MPLVISFVSSKHFHKLPTGYQSCPAVHAYLKRLERRLSICPRKDSLADFTKLIDRSAG